MSKRTVEFPSEVEVTHGADIVVIGGGPGGIGASVAAAREGAKVLLVEHYGFLGGMATAGEVNPFMPNHLAGESLDTGIFEEWLDRMGRYDGIIRNARYFDPQAARLAAEDLCLDAGVELLFHHRTALVPTEARRVTGVVLHSKSGFSAVEAKQYLDCTGDGDVAALAGCRFEFGSEDSGHGQPMTLCFKLKLDPRDAPEGKTELFQCVRDEMPRIQEAYRSAQEDGRIECLRENVLLFRGVKDGIVHFNTTRVIRRSAIDGRQLSAAEIEARRQLRQIVDVLREDVPLFRRASIYSIAPQIGVRESRRIRGRDYVTLDDYKAGRTYPDSIARVTYNVDIHNPNGTGTVHIRLPKNSWYEIPWGCLVPETIDNLAMGCRAISVDHAVHSSMRVMPPVCSIGQAAGTAAAMAVAGGIDLSQIDGVALKKRLIERGRNLTPFDPEHPLTNPDSEAEERNHVAPKRAGLSA